MRGYIGLIVILVLPLSMAAQTPQPAMIQTPFGTIPNPHAEQQPGPTPGPAGQQLTSPATPPVPGFPLGFQAYAPDSPTKVFAIRYVDSRSIQNLLSTFGVPISREPGLNAIAVKAPEKTLDAIEEVIKRFDVPANRPKRVEVTAYL